MLGVESPSKLYRLLFGGGIEFDANMDKYVAPNSTTWPVCSIEGSVCLSTPHVRLAVHWYANKLWVDKLECRQVWIRRRGVD